MRKVTTLGIAAALVAISFGVGCKRQEPSSSNGIRAPKLPDKPPLDLGTFGAHLPQGLQGFVTDETTFLLMNYYGSVLVAGGNATPPPTLVFPDEEAVQRWQSSVKTEKTQINGITVELQAPAMEALLEARHDAQKFRADITPRGDDASRRSYADTVRLWESRIRPGFAHWVATGKLQAEEIHQYEIMNSMSRIQKIVFLESEGFFFSPDFQRPVFTSVAPPGTSQHLSMLALDINEYDNPKVREILAQHGWYRTVPKDFPHFTYLGVQESNLPELGLQKDIVEHEIPTHGSRKAMLIDGEFWVPCFHVCVDPTEGHANPKQKH